MKFDLPQKIFVGLLVIILLLLGLHIAGYVSAYYGNLSLDHFFFEKFHFNEEKNVPSIFSSLLHLFASVSLAMVALSHLNIKTRKWFWWLMSFVFFFLGFDELLRIHEKVRGNSSVLMEGSETFLYSWVIFYGIGLLVLGLVIVKPLFELPKRTFWRFIAAGAIFVFGAFVLENVAGSIVFHEDLTFEEATLHPSLFMLSTFEELLEMLGVSYFIFSVLQFLDRYKEPRVKN